MARVRWSAVTAVVGALTLVGGSGAARDPDQAPKVDSHRHVPGELIVKFRPGVTLSKQEEALAAAGLKAKKKLTADGRFELAAGDPAASEVALKKLGSDPRVAYAEPNFVVSALRTPTDPPFGQLWGLVNTGQTVDGVAGTADTDIDADLAWDVSTDSAASVVGIIDTGVDFSHPDLAGAAWINQGDWFGSGTIADAVRALSPSPRARSAPRRSLRRFDVQTANGRDTFTLRVYDWAAGAWITLFGPTTGLSPDRRLTFDLTNPTRYVSASGEVRVSAPGEHRKGLTVRIDLVSFTVER
jgi:hypothetical protein